MYGPRIELANVSVWGNSGIISSRPITPISLP
jgi:hypothetical protein